MFNLAIDSKPRGGDLVALRVDAVASNGYAIDWANVRQRQVSSLELTETTRQAVDEYLRGADRKLGEYLFPGLGAPGRPPTTRGQSRR